MKLTNKLKDCDNLKVEKWICEDWDNVLAFIIVLMLAYVLSPFYASMF